MPDIPFRYLTQWSYIMRYYGLKVFLRWIFGALQHNFYDTLSCVKEGKNNRWEFKTNDEVGISFGKRAFVVAIDFVVLLFLLKMQIFFKLEIGQSIDGDAVMWWQLQRILS